MAPRVGIFFFRVKPSREVQTTKLTTALTACYAERVAVGRSVVVESRLAGGCGRTNLVGERPDVAWEVARQENRVWRRPTWGSRLGR
jgi:hypothetical protein